MKDLSHFEHLVEFWIKLIIQNALRLSYTHRKSHYVDIVEFFFWDAEIKENSNNLRNGTFQAQYTLNKPSLTFNMLFKSSLHKKKHMFGAYYFYVYFRTIFECCPNGLPSVYGETKYKIKRTVCQCSIYIIVFFGSDYKNFKRWYIIKWRI